MPFTPPPFDTTLRDSFDFLTDPERVAGSPVLRTWHWDTAKEAKGHPIDAQRWARLEGDRVALDVMRTERAVRDAAFWSDAPAPDFLRHPRETSDLDLRPVLRSPLGIAARLAARMGLPAFDSGDAA